MGKAYNATGYVPKIFKGVNGIINLHSPGEEDIYSPKNLPAGALMDRYTSQMHSALQDKSLDKRILAVQFEILFFRNSDHPMLQEYLKKQGIEVNGDFFKLLKERVKKLEDSPATHKESIKFIAKVFEETCDPKQTQFFKMALEELLKIKIQIRSSI